MVSELERDFEKIRAMTTEEIRRKLALQVWGPEAKKIAEAELVRREQTDLQDAACSNLEATARLVEQTARLADATDRLVTASHQQAGFARDMARATRGLVWATAGLLVVTAVLVLAQLGWVPARP